jgi:hypothetical protein
MKKLVMLKLGPFFIVGNVKHGIKKFASKECPNWPTVIYN